ncbi:putative leader peptide [Saccharothrix stipae]
MTTLLTKRLAVDLCRVRSSLCRAARQPGGPAATRTP